MNESPAEVIVNGAKHVPSWVWHMLMVFLMLSGFLYYESTNLASFRTHTVDMEQSIDQRLTVIEEKVESHNQLFTEMQIVIAENQQKLLHQREIMNELRADLRRMERKLDLLISGRKE